MKRLISKYIFLLAFFISFSNAIQGVEPSCGKSLRELAQATLISTAEQQQKPVQTRFIEGDVYRDEIRAADRLNNSEPTRVTAKGVVRIVGKVLFLDGFTIGAHSSGGPNWHAEVGPAKIRQLFQQFADEAQASGFEVLVISGNRISGARVQVGSGASDLRMVFDLAKTKKQ